MVSTNVNLTTETKTTILSPVDQCRIHILRLLLKKQTSSKNGNRAKMIFKKLRSVKNEVKNTLNREPKLSNNEDSTIFLETESSVIKINVAEIFGSKNIDNIQSRTIEKLASYENSFDYEPDSIHAQDSVIHMPNMKLLLEENLAATEVNSKCDDNSIHAQDSVIHMPNMNILLEENLAATGVNSKCDDNSNVKDCCSVMEDKIEKKSNDDVETNLIAFGVKNSLLTATDSTVEVDVNHSWSDIIYFPPQNTKFIQQYFKPRNVVPAKNFRIFNHESQCRRKSERNVNYNNKMSYYMCRMCQPRAMKDKKNRKRKGNTYVCPKARCLIPCSRKVIDCNPDVRKVDRRGDGTSDIRIEPYKFCNTRMWRGPAEGSQIKSLPWKKAHAFFYKRIEPEVVDPIDKGDQDIEESSEEDEDSEPKYFIFPPEINEDDNDRNNRQFFIFPPETNEDDINDRNNRQFFIFPPEEDEVVENSEILPEDNYFSSQKYSIAPPDVEASHSMTFNLVTI